MSYGLKYIMQWASQNANANNYRIELYQKDYSGEVTEKKLGSAPSLVMDNADNGIMGTSLQFSIQADIDEELQELYTTDAKKFKCLLFKNDKQIWTGYLLQELYSEDYIAAPYDVGVTATDQLALLKDVPYAPIGRKTLLEIIHNAITPTQLELGYSVQTSLKPQLQDSDIPFISFVTIDDGGYINYSCYDVISMIMRTCNMTITQIENSWVIARKSDISAEIFSYDSALNLIGQAEPNALVIGRMYENDIWPVGNLVRKFTAVPKTLKFAFSPIVKSSFFDNPTMNGPEYWQYNGTYIEQAPGKYKVTVNRLEYNYNVNAWILRSSNRKTKDFALWQSIDVEQGGASLSLKVSYCPMLFISPVTTTSAKKVQEAKLTVQIKLETDSAEVYYMTKEGWKSEDAGDLTYTANPVTDDPRQRGNKDQYSSAVINFPAIPANGVLTISFRNDSVNYIKSDASNMEPFYEPYLMGVTDVMLTAPDVVGYDSDVILNAQGNSSVEQELFFSDAYGIGNEKKSLYNFIRIGDSDTSDWLLGKSTFETFFKAMVQDTANLASLKNHYSGVISGTLQIGLLYYEKFSGDILRMQRGTLDLLTEDLNGEWLQVPVSDAVYDEIELNTNENNVVKPASVSTSIPTGNFASTDALDALTKIVNILNTIIGLDDDDNAYVKPKSDGTPRNFYTFGTMSFGGIDDGESGEGGGTGITSLYDIPEIAVSAATLADGQSLVYDATLGKWVNRLVQSGSSGVDMAYVWAALAGETTEKINASHIPDLSGVYLPLTGGYMHGNVYFDAGKGIACSNDSANLQIGMYQNHAIYLQGPELYYSPASGTNYQIWHEGNDGSNSGLDADLLDGLDETRFFRRRSIIDSYDSGSALSLGLYMLGNKESETDYFPTGNGTFINLTSTNDKGAINTNYGLQFCANYAAGALYVRSVWYNSLYSWKQLAYITSNVNSATKLQTARTIWGRTFDGTGNITSHLELGNGIAIKVTDDGNTLRNALLMDGYNNLLIGSGNVVPEYTTIIYGNPIAFRLDDSTQPITITANGNLLVGTKTENTTYKLNVYGKTRISDTLNLGAGVQIGNTAYVSFLSKVTEAEPEAKYYNGLYLSSANNFQIGYGTAITGKFKTNLHGYGIDLRSKGTDVATMSLTTNGNVLIGTTTEDTAYRLFVYGRGRFASGVTLNNGTAVYSKDTTGADKALFLLNDANSFMIGSDVANAGYSTYLYGNEILFRLKTGGAQPMYISSNGNVLIGLATDDNTAKLNVRGKIRLSSDLLLNNYTAIKFKDSNGAELNTIMVGTDNAVTIGADHSVKNYETRIKGVGVTLFYGGTQVLSLTSGSKISAKNILPFEGYHYDLGSSSNRWKYIYCYNLDAATRITMQVPDYTYPHAKIIRDTSTGKVYYQAGLVDGSARQGKMGISGIDATKLVSLDINSTLTTISDKLVVGASAEFYTDCLLQVKGAIGTNSYISFGYYGKQLTEDPTSTFRTAMFGDAVANSRLRTFRANEAFGLVAAKYGAGLAWSTADTHAYINVDHMSSEIVYIGGGNQDKLNWQARLYTSKMSLIPDSTTASYSIGDADHMWGGAYIRSLSTNTIGFYRNSANYIWATEAGGYFLFGVKDKGDMNIQNASLVIKATDIRPGHRNAEVDLGTSTYRWNTIYGASLNLSGSISSGNIMPLANNTYNLGTSDTRWGVLYAYYGSFTNGVNSRYYYTLDGTIKAFDVNNSYLAIGDGYVTNELPVYINGKPIQFRASSTPDLTIDANGNAIFYKYLSSSSDGTHLLNWYGEGRFWNLMPQTTEAHDLGGENKRWASAHIKDVVAYNSVKIGDATLVWDAVNQCLVVDKNFVSDGSISFGGLEPPTEDDYLATNGGTILGNLGIGNASNTGKNLNLYGNQYFWHKTTPTKGVYLFLDSTAGDRLALRNVDNSIAAKFFVYGNLHYQGTISQLSDMRFKQVIEDLCLSSEIIANAPLFKYKRKDSGDDRVYIGSSAQYWQEVAPELTPLVDDYLTLDYATLGVMMGKSNATEIELLKERMKILEAKVENYERILGII